MNKSNESEPQQAGRQGGSQDIQESTRRATRKVLRWLPWAILNLVVVGASIAAGSIALTGTAITLAIFSPILVPTGILLFVTVGGGLAIVAVGLAVMSACYGLYTHIKASHANENSPTKEDPPADYGNQVLAAAGA